MVRQVLFLYILINSVNAYSDHLTFQDVYPVLMENCLVCHHNPGAPRGLSMETYAEMMKGSVNGVVVIAGDLGNSELIKRIKGISHPRMPMNGPPYLSDLEVELISSWVESGAILK